MHMTNIIKFLKLRETHKMCYFYDSIVIYLLKLSSHT